MPTKTYKDFDASFRSHPLTKDLRTKTDAEAISFAIKSLILTVNGERPFNSDIGTPIKALLFELYGDHTNILLKRMVSDSIQNYEPRAELIDILINPSPDNNALYISIQYRIKNAIQPYVLNLVLERTR
jgi:phage baseplate assembly protein W